MEEALLWFDGDKKKAASEKIRAGAERFAEKFGRKPNRCYVNEHYSVDLENVLDGIKVVGARRISWGYFWLCTEEEDVCRGCRELLADK